MNHHVNNGRWVPTTEHDDPPAHPVDPHENFEEWLRRTTTEAADTEINLQLGEFALKKNRVETLESRVRELPDFIQVFGSNETNMGVAAATVQRCQYRNWLRLVGRRHDVQLWTGAAAMVVRSVRRERTRLTIV